MGVADTQPFSKLFLYTGYTVCIQKGIQFYTLTV